MSEQSIAILYEHPDWFAPLFVELDARGVNYERLHIADVSHDPGVQALPYSLVVNRVSAYPSGGSHPGIVLYVPQYLAYLAAQGVRVINGHDSFLVGASKSRQLDILETLGLSYPRARVFHHPSKVVDAANGLRYPIVVKPNIGGSGVGIQRFDSSAALAQSVQDGAIDMGIDHTALVQEFLTAANRKIIRVEILDGEFLYALGLPVSDDSFNYCPADGCMIENPAMAMEVFTPSAQVIDDAIRIMAAAKTDVGGVEYLINADSGEVTYYDINPLSNFVADAPRLLGFDPWAKFVDYLMKTSI